ncbi:hypothetical protein FRACYDRAFT_166366, partial [Fragilariopsis cylindrus CCMP1102]
MSPSSWRTVLLLLIVCLSCAKFYTVTAITTATAKSISTSPSLSRLSLIQKLRGGESTTATNISTPINSSKKKKKRSKTKRNSDIKAKKVIDGAMKEKDAAEALGDAIRDRADTLRQDKMKNDPLLQSIDGSVASVGRAMGASDYDVHTETRGAGGVQASTSSVIANYFLKSHGGAHLLQSASSLLATACAVGTLFMTSNYSNVNPDVNAKWTLVLLRRTLIFAMIKHASGLLASASMAAKAIPKIGISQSRTWMESIVQEPVAQYVFYTALLLLWLPSKGIAATWWWPRHRWIISWLVGPILLREVVSNILIVSDILVLWSVGCGEQDNGVLERVLKTSQSIVNAVMSLLVSPTRWRSADPAQRQAILSGLISKISLFLEAGVGGILVVDFFVGLIQLLFGGVIGGSTRRPAWYEALTKMIVIRLYVHYLVHLRRKKLSKLATAIRGGAVRLPFWVLDTLFDPTKAIGVVSTSKASEEYTNKEGFSWRDFLSIGLGLD